MKKMMLAAMAAMVICSTGTALAATPGAVNFRDNTTRIETNYAHCGGGYHHGDREGRGGYGCGGGYGDGYCWGANSEG
ncbi:MAG: hypothetical protein J6Z82_08945 [Schwartzia sp.]|nr:hypothetical protein [Schwartzia sp. (in: firmicutes)]